MSRLRGRQEQSGAAGLRRVDWVRFVVDHNAVRAEAVGVGYPLPATRIITLSLAGVLIAQGTPSVTRRREAVTVADQPGSGIVGR
jgi:hypothetical protein